jgi:transcriptional regulator with XRE-family HTH domain
MTSDSVDLLYRAIGKLVRLARERAALTQEQLAARVGLTRTSITNIERGRQKIQVHTLCAIAEAVGVPCSALLPAITTQLPNAIDRDRLHKLPLPEREWVERVIAAKEDGVPV